MSRFKLSAWHETKKKGVQDKITTNCFSPFARQQNLLYSMMNAFEDDKFIVA